ncbi:hypothetical protein D046_8309, partial [Vibrio parahaemolyticus V-223/04]
MLFCNLIEQYWSMETVAPFANGSNRHFTPSKLHPVSFFN